MVAHGLHGQINAACFGNRHLVAFCAHSDKARPLGRVTAQTRTALLGELTTLGGQLIKRSKNPADDACITSVGASKVSQRGTSPLFAEMDAVFRCETRR